MRYPLISALLALLMQLHPAGTVALESPSVLVKFNELQRDARSQYWKDRQQWGQLPEALPAATVDRGLTAIEQVPLLEAGVENNYRGFATGQLLFMTPEREVRSCTATFVASSNMLITAARCIVSPEGVLHSHFIFLSGATSSTPIYYDISCVAYPEQWTRKERSRAWRYNYAFLKTHRTSVFEGLGITNALVFDKLAQIGFTDEESEEESIRGIENDSYMTGDGLLGSRYTPLGAGSSGNPWVRSHVIYSVTSHYDPAHPDLLFGPRFSYATMELMARVKEEC